jgi:hypothetical protein
MQTQSAAFLVVVLAVCTLLAIYALEPKEKGEAPGYEAGGFIATTIGKVRA